MKIKLRGGVSLAEQISFYRQLAVILRSGLPLLNALQLLQKHGSAKQMLLCYRLQQRLRRGSSLASQIPPHGGTDHARRCGAGDVHYFSVVLGP